MFDREHTIARGRWDTFGPKTNYQTPKGLYQTLYNIIPEKAITAANREVQEVLASVDKKQHYTCRRSYLFPFRMETFAQVLQSKWLNRHGTHECTMPHALQRSKVSIFSVCTRCSRIAQKMSLAPISTKI